VDLLAVGGAAVSGGIALLAEDPAAAETGFQINFFWIITQAISFLIFLAILYFAAFRRIGGVLEERRSRIEQGLQDAEQARRDRESAEAERIATLQEARREANDILARAQKVAQDSRDADIAATKAELERMRERAAADIEAEKQRAIADLRGEVADLALRAAGRVVGETLSTERERRLVADFLAETSGPPSGGSGS
jgi:F-type H+-transporting ATPase subunit b